MTRKEFEDFVLDTYGVRADYPFEEDFETGVFRHENSGKWFAIAMNISERKLGKDGNMQIEVVNLKCAPEVIESLAEIEHGIYRAYHMNKTHWLTVALAECDDETIGWLLGISYDLTKKKNRKTR
jgi:predicted DNA-binding protein (MmcQ/YjbR family)